MNPTIKHFLHQFQVIGKLKQTSEDNTNAVLGGLIGGLVVVGGLAGFIWACCLKRRQKLSLRKEEENAVRQNELNAVNAINKTKMLDDYKIVNALDYPSSHVSSSAKSVNTNPNLADEELFSAKDSSYNVSKQLNTSLESNRTSLMLCNKLDNASSVVSVSKMFLILSNFL